MHDLGTRVTEIDKRKMQRFLTGFSYINKPLVYNGLKKNLNNQLASITSICLNTEPLPKQPVPSLEKTAEKYLRSVQPLLRNHELENTRKILSEFLSPGSLGRQLYEKLLEKYEQKDNWFSEWWLREAYLGYRYPVIVHSSPGTVGPTQKFNSPVDFYKYTARAISAICGYNKMIISGNIKQETLRDKTPLNMQPYAMILGSHRQPAPTYDKLLHVDDSQHIIVISNNHFFKVKVGHSINEGTMMGIIKHIDECSTIPAKPVGILTGADRDTWADTHKKLIALGTNQEIIKEIETALFVLCLDKALPKELLQTKNNESIRALQSLTGINSSINAGNRWHDKIVQFIISRDGFVGMTYEHSPCEGGPIAVLTDHVVKYVNSKESEQISPDSNFDEPKHLKFSIDKAMECSIEKAAKSVDELSQDIDMECFKFEDFGADEIKKCKLSPDSFIQIAMQITYYKIHRKPPAHYESAALRSFQNARTEAIRSTSNESVEFAKLMVDKRESKEELKKSMLKAINAHKSYANDAASGEGVDRLFFGLKMIAKENNIELPKFYTDVAYQRSSYWNLTSSQVAYKTDSFMCYGPVVPDGYGCCYNPRPKDIKFGCSSFNQCSETNTKLFGEVLKESLRDMIKLCQTTSC